MDRCPNLQESLGYFSGSIAVTGIHCSQFLSSGKQILEVKKTIEINHPKLPSYLAFRSRQQNRVAETGHA